MGARWKNTSITPKFICRLSFTKSVDKFHQDFLKNCNLYRVNLYGTDHNQSQYDWSLYQISMKAYLPLFSHKIYIDSRTIGYRWIDFESDSESNGKQIFFLYVTDTRTNAFYPLYLSWCRLYIIKHSFYSALFWVEAWFSFNIFIPLYFWSFTY